MSKTFSGQTTAQSPLPSHRFRLTTGAITPAACLHADVDVEALLMRDPPDACRQRTTGSSENFRAPRASSVPTGANAGVRGNRRVLESRQTESGSESAGPSRADNRSHGHR